MARIEVLARYRPIRPAIRRVLHQATIACSQTDLTRAGRQVAPWAEQDLLANEEAAEMLVDVALFEPNQRNRRAFDRFLVENGERLEGVDRALAERMAGAWFSLFRNAGQHEAAGLWLEDLLDGDRRFWLVDEALEVSAAKDTVFGMRLFDTGPFHAGFGIIVVPDQETLDFCVAAKARGVRGPFRHSLAATLYGDQLRASTPPGVDDLALLETVLDVLAPSLSVTRKAGSEEEPSRSAHRRRQTRRWKKHIDRSRDIEDGSRR